MKKKSTIFTLIKKITGNLTNCLKGIDSRNTESRKDQVQVQIASVPLLEQT